MKVTVEQIKAKIDRLPANVRDLVTIDPKDASLARVKSFSKKDVVYDIHIGVHADDPGDKTILDSACPCDARTLCHHVVAFYAVSKGLLPMAGFLPESGQEDAEPKEDALRRLTKEAIHADLCAHEALAAMLEEIERRTR